MLIRLSSTDSYLWNIQKNNDSVSLISIVVNNNNNYYCWSLTSTVAFTQDKAMNEVKEENKQNEDLLATKPIGADDPGQCFNCLSLV